MGGRQQWTEGRLGNYAYIKARIGWRGLSADEYTHDGPYLIAGNHIHNGQINWSLCDHISNYRYQESWEIALEEKDVILTKDGTIGRVAFVNRLPGLATINGTMMLVRAQPPLVPKFVYHYLTGERFQKLVTEKVSGSSIPHIFQRDLVELSIPILPQEEQHRIAEILDTADAAIRQSEAHIAKLKQIKDGMLHDLLTRGINAEGCLRDPVAHPEQFKDSVLGRIPREWEVTSLDHYTISSAFGPRFSSKQYNESQGRVAIMRTTDMDDEGNVTLSTMPLAKLNPNHYKPHLLESGDLLITRSGTCGIATVFTGFHLPVLPGAFLIRFRLAPGLLPEFMQRYFNWEKGRNRLLLEAEGGVQKNLRGSTLLKLLIPVPSQSEQNHIVTLLDIHDNLIRTKEARLAKLRQVKHGLMRDLLTGRVRV